MRPAAATLSLLICPVIALGHHSRAEFADETMQIEGVLTKVIWQNPHTALFLDVEAADGQIETWRIEGWTGPAELERTGVTRDLFEIGERLVVVGKTSRVRKAILGTNVLLASGAEAILTSTVGRHWDGPQVGGASQPAPPLVDAAAEGSGIFRAWFPAGNPMMALRRFPFAQEAIAARDSRDPVDNPIVRCEQPGMPVPLFHPRPILFTQQGQDISLRHGYFDTQRTIHMDERLSAQDQPQSHLGFSKGHWENDRTLVIETTRVNYPYFDIDGTTQSDAIVITERYSLSDDQARLDFHVTIEDPLALAGTAVAEWHFLALDEPFSVYECNVF